MEIEAVLFVGFVVIVVIIAVLAITVSGRSSSRAEHVCPACGGGNPTAAQFCRRCGKKLER